MIETYLCQKGCLRNIHARILDSPPYPVYFYAFLLISGNLGQISGSILAGHKGAIEKYIMVGYGRGWGQCDIIAESRHAESGFEAFPKLIMDLQNLNKFEPIAYSSSHCFLMTYNVNSDKTLEALIKFGKSVILKKRLALVLKLGPNITLDTVIRTSMPILVAAKLHNGGEQFLCPAVGEDESQMQDHMCGPEYTTYRNKVLRIGMLGMYPYLKVTNGNGNNLGVTNPNLMVNGGRSIEGVDFDLLQLLVSRRNFVTNITVPRNLPASIYMV